MTFAKHFLKYMLIFAVLVAIDYLVFGYSLHSLFMILIFAGCPIAGYIAWRQSKAVDKQINNAVLRKEER